MERYRILYTWKTLEGLFPNCGIQSRSSERLGRFCVIPPINKKSSQKIQSLKEKSFTINGPMLFYILTMQIRDMTKCSVEDFKTKLDQFLYKIPDQPRTPALVPEASNQITAKASNCRIDQIRRVTINANDNTRLLFKW